MLGHVGWWVAKSTAAFEKLPVSTTRNEHFHRLHRSIQRPTYSRME
jgi:hypothetical protein